MVKKFLILFSLFLAGSSSAGLLECFVAAKRHMVGLFQDLPANNLQNVRQKFRDEADAEVYKRESDLLDAIGWSREDFENEVASYKKYQEDEKPDDHPITQRAYAIARARSIEGIIFKLMEKSYFLACNVAAVRVVKDTNKCSEEWDAFLRAHKKCLEAAYLVLSKIRLTDEPFTQDLAKHKFLKKQLKIKKRAYDYCVYALPGIKAYNNDLIKVSELLDPTLPVFAFLIGHELTHHIKRDGLRDNILKAKAYNQDGKNFKVKEEFKLYALEEERRANVYAHTYTESPFENFNEDKGSLENLAEAAFFVDSDIHPDCHESRDTAAKILSAMKSAHCTDSANMQENKYRQEVAKALVRQNFGL